MEQRRVVVVRQLVRGIFVRSWGTRNGSTLVGRRDLPRVRIEGKEAGQVRRWGGGRDGGSIYDSGGSSGPWTMVNAYRAAASPSASVLGGAPPAASSERGSDITADS